MLSINIPATFLFQAIRDLFVLTHDAKLKEDNYEGISSFLNLLKYWKSVHAMKNPEPC